MTDSRHDYHYRVVHEQEQQKHMITRDAPDLTAKWQILFKSQENLSPLKRKRPTVIGMKNKGMPRISNFIFA